MKVKSSEKLPYFTLSVKRNWIIVLVVYLVFVFLSPILFAKASSWVSFDGSSGVIGDTIGGITAPFINLLAAFLVYLSFNAQIKANQQLNKENEFNYISNLFNLVKKDFHEKNLIILGRSVKKSNLNFILDWMISADNELRFAGNINPNAKVGEVEPNLYDEQYRIGEINTNIREPLQIVRSQVYNFNNLILEIKNSSIEQGIKTFYRFQIERMLFEMDLSILLTDYFIIKMRPDEVLKGSENKAAFRDCKMMAEAISMHGYKIRSGLEE